MKMRNNIYVIMALVTMLTIGSCREQADHLVSYGQEDHLNFMESDTCFEGQFKAVWTALNCNYGIWDYEAKFGLDWDAVYRKYLPKMQELDKRDKETNPVTDEELRKLYGEIVGPLHDGHFMLQVKNLHTNNYSEINPSEIRNASRPDYDIKEVPRSDYYYTDAAGENMFEDYLGVSVHPARYAQKEIDKALTKIMSSIEELEAIENRTARQDYLLDCYHEAYQDLSNFRITTVEGLDYYNNILTTKYQNLDITLNPFDIDLSYLLDFEYATFNDGIVYLRLSSFCLSPYLGGAVSGSPCSDYYFWAVCEIWSQWFDKIQDFHNSGRLKGVIIDVRCNGGGYTSDYQCVLGALLPEGGHHVASLRTKVGIGRYDYAPLIPRIDPTLSIEHATITEPVVVLANCHSVSMAEETCLGAKQMENGRVIGTQTWGAMCSLRNDPSAYSFNYAGVTGVENTTSFYAYIPTLVTVSLDGEIFEGVGVTPDIEAPLDMDLFNTTGRDSQLERALQYIRTGN